MELTHKLRKIVGGTQENISRSVVKTALYRLLMVLITVTVALIVTRNVKTALNIGILTNVIKTGTYYGYERLWTRVEWGYEKE